MKTVDGSQYYGKVQYSTTFSSLTAAANLLLKVKSKIQVDSEIKDQNKRENFDLDHNLSNIKQKFRVRIRIG